MLRDIPELQESVGRTVEIRTVANALELADSKRRRGSDLELLDVLLDM